MNNKATMKLRPRPTVEDLVEHRPLSGSKRVLALAYVRRRRVYACSALLASVTVFAAYYISPSVFSTGIVAPATSEQGMSGLSPATRDDAPVKTAPAEPPVSAALPDPVVTPELNMRHADAVPTGQFSTDLGSMDMKDLVAAVDNLGIRVAEAEKRILPPLDEKKTERKSFVSEPLLPVPDVDDATPSVDAAPTPSDKDPVPESGHANLPQGMVLTEDDARIFDRLKARVDETRRAGTADALKRAEAELSMFRSTLETMIEFKVVDRKGEKAGFWRAAADRPDDRQFYLVVEAQVAGETVKWAIRDADSGRIVSGERFGLKVDEKTFAEFAEDKKDDGRFRDAVVGIKPTGRIAPAWSVKTDGQTITEIGK